MHRYVFAVLCLIGVFAISADAQNATIEPISIPVGAIVTFHLQTRLNPASANELDALPKGTLIRVRVSSAMDSTVDHDGSEFRGALIAPILSGKNVVVPSGAEARGLLVLLRSRNHPAGFRYELLITKIIESGRTLDLTASLNASLVDADKSHETPVGSEPLARPGTPVPPGSKLPAAN
jgi:hypothetical protein